MNFIVTLNIGNHLCCNARSSFLHAANRWGCTFHEITEDRVPHQHLFFNKVVGIKRLCEEVEVDRILYVDGDMLIRSDAPNPFEVFRDGVMFYAALDCKSEPGTDEYNFWANDVAEPWLSQVHEAVEPKCGGWNLLLRYRKSWFFNSGMFLFDPYVREDCIDMFIRNIPTVRVSDRIEQAMWNYCNLYCGGVQYVEQTWNRLDPDLSQGRMLDYIYHFTGFKQYAPPIKEQLLSFNWQA